jgi:hypothetical protein
MSGPRLPYCLAAGHDPRRGPWGVEACDSLCLAGFAVRFSPLPGRLPRNHGDRRLSTTGFDSRDPECDEFSPTFGIEWVEGIGWTRPEKTDFEDWCCVDGDAARAIYCPAVKP